MRPRPAPSGFTLVELLIVIVILGVLAAIVIPTTKNVSKEAEQSRFASNLHSFVGQAELYRAKTGEHVEDGSSGLVPAGFEPYVRAEDWEAGTPVGGVWDTETSSFGITSALGVHFQSNAKPDEYMTEIDVLLGDDGDLQTGLFRKIASGRFYFILMP